jgi:large subunit ribosomal protein L24
MHIKVNDMVEVISGAESSVRLRGKVLRVLPREGKIVVEGVRRVYKHVRRSQRNPQGGRLSKEMPIPISTVRLVCSKCGKATRTGARYLADGSKQRYCKKCDASLGQIAPPRPAYAQTNHPASLDTSTAPR